MRLGEEDMTTVNMALFETGCWEFKNVTLTCLREPWDLYEQGCWGGKVENRSLGFKSRAKLVKMNRRALKCIVGR